MTAPYQPTPGALERALQLVATREAAFIADCAGGRDRQRIADTFGLSFEQLDMLEKHYAGKIRDFAYPQAPAWVAPIDRSLPPGDRE